ncbi:MAG: AmmeMemoRadiSam system protein B [Elusimicrobiota bacterium]
MREPAVAGKFYPSDSNELNNTVKKYMDVPGQGEKKVQGVIVPHAGYIFSGKVAGLTYSGIRVPDRVVIIGPNHTGQGKPASIMKKGSWRLPPGKVDIAENLASDIASKSSFLASDSKAHLSEHSIEVQLPFLLYKNPNIEFVPICLGISNSNIDCIEDIGKAIAGAVESTGGDVLIVASSDMSHFVTKEEAQKCDNLAIDKIKELDYTGLLDVVRDNRISMCGAAPVAVTIKASIELGADECEFIHYNTSARVTGDDNRVVGYAGLRIR